MNRRGSWTDQSIAVAATSAAVRDDVADVQQAFMTSLRLWTMPTQFNARRYFSYPSQQAAEANWSRLGPPTESDLVDDLQKIARARGTPGKDALAFICAVDRVAAELIELRPEIAQHLDVISRGLDDLYTMLFFGQKPTMFIPVATTSGRPRHPLCNVARGACLATLELLSSGRTRERENAARRIVRLTAHIADLLTDEGKSLDSSTILRWRRDRKSYPDAHEYFAKILVLARLQIGERRLTLDQCIRYLLDVRTLWLVWEGPRPNELLMDPDI